MVAAACLTMALPHLLIGVRQRGARVHLLFALAGFAVAWMAAQELSVMRAVTTQASGRAVQIAQAPTFIVLVAIVGFVHLYLGTARLWLGALTCAVRAISLVVNFVEPPNVNFRQVTALRSYHFLGETVTMPVGPRNPWILLAYCSSLLVLAFVIDASWKLWRRGTPDNRRRAVVVGGSIVFFIIVAQGASVLINAGAINFPYFVSIPFMVIVAAMGFELSYDVVRGAELSRALRESEERMGLAAESARLSLWEWDVARDDVWMTREGRALLGIKPDTRIDFASLGRCVHPEDRVLREATIRRAVETGGSYEVEYRLLLPDGSVRWIAARGRCADGDHGSATRLLGVSMDITQQKQADAEARLQREELGHLARVALVGEMATSLAHELNQPLTAIVMNASAAQRFIAHGDMDPDELRDLLADIAADGRRAGEVIHGIKGMVRRVESEHQALAVNEIVANVLRLVRADALVHGCALTTELDLALPPVLGDAVQLQQVLLNLIINAFDAMRRTPCDPCRVEIVSQRLDAKTVEVSVRDFGSGLPSDAPARVFERFFSTKREGMGMGLAIARSIIEAHAGTLGAENAKGGGARFWFRVPAHIVASAEAPA
jgi:two-component system, LuxR family, sensor kinase FixL